MATTEPRSRRTSSYILRVTDRSNANIKSLVEQAEADEDVEILEMTREASRTSTVYEEKEVESIEGLSGVDLPKPPKIEDQSSGERHSKERPITVGRSTHRPRNSFLVRVTKKKKKRKRKYGGAKRKGQSLLKKGIKPKGFIEKLKQDTEEGKVECFHVEQTSQTGRVKHERQLSHKDLAKISLQNPVGPKLLAAFQSSPAIQPSRASYLDLMNQARDSSVVTKINPDNIQRDCMAGKQAEIDKAQNAEIARVQREYIEALESEVKRSKVRADLIDRQQKMELGRLEVLLHSRDEELVHKDLLVQSLQLQNRNLQKDISKKDNVIDIQGQYVTGLEVENKALARKLGLSAIPMLPQSEETDSLRDLYRRVSEENLD